MKSVQDPPPPHPDRLSSTLGVRADPPNFILRHPRTSFSLSQPFRTGSPKNVGKDGVSIVALVVDIVRSCRFLCRTKSKDWLVDGLHFAHLVTLMPDGSPQSVPVWVAVRSDNLLICTGKAY